MLPLPEDLPDDAVVGHDVTASPSGGYRLFERVWSGAGAAKTMSLDLSSSDDGITVHAAPTSAVYPRLWASRRLFTLAPGEAARYEANFRFRGCQCTANWWYEEWTVNIANAAATPELFLERTPRHQVDHRVNLYGAHSPKRTGSAHRR
ncbi:hypothetical protein QEZ54_20190 [Catellatospora sp. KI3]|uniref:hypothetical protein n=1 Tax=Catellatospora sp. KI3 TaxID=3041620 RepID=UPI002482CD35|nr:hypothetical protein [Catellatospora sp. KI3]MDI1463307.1 hypothetical protein [Catellatospora sp. KI3]